MSLEALSPHPPSAVGRRLGVCRRMASLQIVTLAPPAQHTPSN